MTITPPPSPAAATDEATFMAGLRALKTWCGLSFRQLERRASAAGETLPSSTASTMLGKNRLPREELLVAFVRGCGLGEEHVRAWAAARTKIADGTAAAPVAAPSRHAAWRRPVIVATALAMALATAFAGGAAVTALFGSGSIDTEETAVVTR
ncbi:hypothetical protein ACIBQ1_20045 [Nonomuraea sp. NPDC050153]|uniref:hypothetical protein n=1 Tax=Nonomuraea sp. NPDC050153 TaxID=3364359 RepID=UPI0037AFB86E